MRAQAKRTAASDGRELEEVTSSVPTFAKVAEMYLNANAPDVETP